MCRPDRWCTRKGGASPSPYDEQVHQLAAMFAENFEQYEDTASEEIQQAGPEPKTATAA